MELIIGYWFAKKPPFMLRESQHERRAFEIVGDFPFMLSPVEAFIGFSAESLFRRICSFVFG
jgi:hypothetical protein